MDNGKIKIAFNTESFYRPFPLRGVELTPRQMQVAVGIAEGKTNREIASDLSISHNVVKKYARAVLAATKLKSRDEVAEATVREHRSESGDYDLSAYHKPFTLSGEKITKKQFEVLALLVTGMTVEKAAKVLRRPVKTIDGRIERLHDRTGLKDNFRVAVAVAREHPDLFSLKGGRDLEYYGNVAEKELTETEEEVLDYIKQGMINPEIAQALDLPLDFIQRRVVTSIRQKFGIDAHSNRVPLIILLNLLYPDDQQEELVAEEGDPDEAQPDNPEL